MKKLLSFLLILALLLSSVALSEDLSSICGGWATVEKLTTGSPSMSFFYLAEDYKSYYLIQSFKEEEPGLGRAYVGYWEVMEDGSVFVKTGNNTSLTLSFSDGRIVAFDVKTFQIYIHYGEYIDQIMENLK